MMGRFTWRKMIGHLRVVLTHKWYVFQFMRKAGRPIQGLCHDLSKFSPIEFIESVRYFSGDRSQKNTPGSPRIDPWGGMA